MDESKDGSVETQTQAPSAAEGEPAAPATSARKGRRGRGQGRKGGPLHCHVKTCEETTFEHAIVTKDRDENPVVRGVCGAHDTDNTLPVQLAFAEARRMKAEREAGKLREQVRELKAKQREQKKSAPPATPTAKKPDAPATQKGAERKDFPPGAYERVKDIVEGRVGSKADGICSMESCRSKVVAKDVKEGPPVFVEDMTHAVPHPICWLCYLASIIARREQGHVVWAFKNTEMFTKRLKQIESEQPKGDAEPMNAAEAAHQVDRRDDPADREADAKHYDEMARAHLNALERGDFRIPAMSRRDGCAHCGHMERAGYAIEPSGIIRPACRCIADADRILHEAYLQAERDLHGGRNALHELGALHKGASKLAGRIEEYEQELKKFLAFHDRIKVYPTVGEAERHLRDRKRQEDRPSGRGRQGGQRDREQPKREQKPAPRSAAPSRPVVEGPGKEERREARRVILDALKPHLTEFASDLLAKGLPDYAVLMDAHICAIDETVVEALAKLADAERGTVEAAHQLLKTHRANAQTRAASTPRRSNDLRDEEKQERRGDGELAPIAKEEETPQG